MGDKNHAWEGCFLNHSRFRFFFLSWLAFNSIFSSTTSFFLSRSNTKFRHALWLSFGDVSRMSAESWEFSSLQASNGGWWCPWSPALPLDLWCAAMEWTVNILGLWKKPAFNSITERPWEEMGIMDLCHAQGLLTQLWAALDAEHPGAGKTGEGTVEIPKRKVLAVLPTY